MNRLPELLRLMRPYHWVKNLFVFTGLLFGHGWHDTNLVMAALLAFGAFCLAASAVYVFNDIHDAAQDRLHPAKQQRPLAAGSVAVPVAAMLAAVLAAAGLVLAYAAAPAVLAIVLGYVLMNIAYTLRLKHVVILDVFIIAAGFMLRIFAGTSGIGIPPSKWLLLCGLMLTLFLGFAKRRAEIIALDEDGANHRRVLEQYSAVFLDKMIGIAAAGLIMSYSLYTMSADTIRVQGTTDLIYTVPLVMYGVFRYIYLLHHQHKGGDPSRDLLRDPHLLFVVAGWLAMTLLMIA